MTEKKEIYGLLLEKEVLEEGDIADTDFMDCVSKKCQAHCLLKENNIWRHAFCCQCAACTGGFSVSPATPRLLPSNVICL